MQWKVIVPKLISRAVGELGISRWLTVRLLTSIHQDLPLDAPRFRHFRVPKDQRLFNYRVILPDGEIRHLFAMAVDDTTADGYLMIVDLRHAIVDGF